MILRTYILILESPNVTTAASTCLAYVVRSVIMLQQLIIKNGRLLAVHLLVCRAQMCTVVVFRCTH